MLCVDRQRDQCVGILVQLQHSNDRGNCIQHCVRFELCASFESRQRIKLEVLKVLHMRTNNRYDDKQQPKLSCVLYIFCVDNVPEYSVWYKISGR